MPTLNVLLPADAVAATGFCAGRPGRLNGEAVLCLTVQTQASRTVPPGHARVFYRAATPREAAALEEQERRAAEARAEAEAAEQERDSLERGRPTATSRRLMAAARAAHARGAFGHPFLDLLEAAAQGYLDQARAAAPRFYEQANARRAMANHLSRNVWCNPAHARGLAESGARFEAADARHAEALAGALAYFLSGRVGFAERTMALWEGRARDETPAARVCAGAAYADRIAHPLGRRPADAPASPAEPSAGDPVEVAGIVVTPLHGGCAVRFAYDRPRNERFRRAFPKARWGAGTRSWHVPGTLAAKRVMRWAEGEESAVTQKAKAEGRARADAEWDAVEPG